MARMTKLTHERLLQVLNYDPVTGVFCWKVRASNRIKIGDRAGVVGTLGYRLIVVDGEKLQASRLALFYVRGEWPIHDVKFLNENMDDCSLGNLKEMSRIEAARLRSAPSNNTSGVRGVSPAKNDNWKAAITANYKQINLGVYPTKEEASEIYEFAMAMLVGANTAEQCEAALEKIVQHRRKKVAWNRMVRTGRPTEWKTFQRFADDVGFVDEDHTTIAAVDEAKPIGPSNFKWLHKTQGEFDRSTKEGRAAYMRAYREANPGRWRHAHLKSNYGVDDPEYHRLLDLQSGVCAICERKMADEALAIDHDHDTKAVRGLLCKPCNYGIGQFGDNPRLLRLAAEYLESHGASTWSTPSITEITHLPIGQKILEAA